MKILQIEAHPDFNNENRTANKLAKVAYDEFISAGINKEDIETIQLYDPKLLDLRITAQTITGQEDQSLTLYREKLIQQFIDADQVYIYMPLHNFNLTSHLKDYFDTILVANKTFKYTEHGSVGLLSDDKKVTFVMTSGSEYDLDYRYKNLDLAPQAMASLLHMMGIQNLKVIRAQGLDIITNDKQEIIERTEKELIDWIKVNNK